jgi:hypothetical protein
MPLSDMYESWVDTKKTIATWWLQVITVITSHVLLRSYFHCKTEMHSNFCTLVDWGFRKCTQWHLHLALVVQQVLSWKPRALLFPNFATKEKCEAIIALARRRLHPSALALRKGETVDSTKDIRTRWVPVALSAITWLTTHYHMSSWVTFCEKFNVPLNHTLELKKVHENLLKSRDNYSGEEGPSNGACLYWALFWRSRMELMNWTVFVETSRQLRDIFESEWGQNRSIGLGGGENGEGNYDTSSSWRGLPSPS